MRNPVKEVGSKRGGLRRSRLLELIQLRLSPRSQMRPVMEERLQGELVHVVPVAHRLVQEIARDNGVGTRNVVGFGLRSPLLAARPLG